MLLLARLQSEVEAGQAAIAGFEHSTKEQRAALLSAQTSLASETALRSQAQERSRTLLEEKQVMATAVKHERI